LESALRKDRLQRHFGLSEIGNLNTVEDDGKKNGQDSCTNPAREDANKR